MLTNTRTSLKQPPKVVLKPKIPRAKASAKFAYDSEFLEAKRQINIEYAKNMWTAYYLSIGFVIMLILMLLGLYALYQRDGHVQPALLLCASTTSTSIIMNIIWTWYQTRDFFTYLKKKGL